MMSTKASWSSAPLSSRPWMVGSVARRRKSAHSAGLSGSTTLRLSFQMTATRPSAASLGYRGGRHEDRGAGRKVSLGPAERAQRPLRVCASSAQGRPLREAKVSGLVSASRHLVRGGPTPCGRTPGLPARDRTNHSLSDHAHIRPRISTDARAPVPCGPTPSARSASPNTSAVTDQQLTIPLTPPAPSPATDRPPARAPSSPASAGFRASRQPSSCRMRDSALAIRACRRGGRGAKLGRGKSGSRSGSMRHGPTAIRAPSACARPCGPSRSRDS